MICSPYRIEHLTFWLCFFPMTFLTHPNRILFFIGNLRQDKNRLSLTRHRAQSSCQDPERQTNKLSHFPKKIHLISSQMFLRCSHQLLLNCARTADAVITVWITSRRKRETTQKKKKEEKTPPPPFPIMKRVLHHSARRKLNDIQQPHLVQTLFQKYEIHQPSDDDGYSHRLIWFSIQIN